MDSYPWRGIHGQMDVMNSTGIPIWLSDLSLRADQHHTTNLLSGKLK